MHAILAVMSALMAVNATRDQPLLWPLYVFATLSAMGACSANTTDGCVAGPCTDDAGPVFDAGGCVVSADTIDQCDVASMPTIGWFRCTLPVEPWNAASPNEKIPPSRATNQ